MRYLKHFDKLFKKRWIIGICRGNISDIIRSKKFDPDINWLNKVSIEKYVADPFLLSTKNGNYEILFEDYSLNDRYGKISLMSLDKNFRIINQKIILDTNSHLSYPFVFTENEKTYIFPESAQSGKLSCYEFDREHKTISFVKDLIELPLLDSTILKYNEKYWIFGILSDNGKNYRLKVLYSNSLLGPYTIHPYNNIYDGLNGTRAAGSFIEVDGNIYRPTQNCEEEYGESITINKVIELTENTFIEEPYMTLSLNKKNKHNLGMHKMHTINVMDNIVVVDSMLLTFAPIYQFMKTLRSAILPWRYEWKED